MASRNGSARRRRRAKEVGLGRIVEPSLRSTSPDSEPSHPLAPGCLGSQRTGEANGRSGNGYKRAGLTFTLRAGCVPVRPKENVRPRPDARGFCAKEIVLISHGSLPPDKARADAIRAAAEIN